jgi:hypothetical protein
MHRGALALVVLAAAAAPGDRVTLVRARLSFALPPGWHFTTVRVNGVLDPVTLFTATSFRFRPSPASSGLCSRALQRQWHADGAYVQLAEERDGASLKTMLRRAPPRPRHVRLDATGAGGLCTRPDSGELTFRTKGRAFYVFYGIGRRASPATRAAAARLLDSLRIPPRS